MSLPWDKELRENGGSKPWTPQEIETGRSIGGWYYDRREAVVETMKNRGWDIISQPSMDGKVYYRVRPDPS